MFLLIRAKSTVSSHAESNTLNATDGVLCVRVRLLEASIEFPGASYKGTAAGA